ncbi:MAG: hypothetical protein IJG13_18700, partial [Kiritimatiellae bacterium]|nr:hypothetical protein [Kiritimatiellia bacterium]
MVCAFGADHEPVGAANRALCAIAWSTAPIRPKASAGLHADHSFAFVCPAFAKAAAHHANLRFSPRRRTRTPAFAGHEHFADSLALPVALQEQNGLGA